MSGRRDSTGRIAMWGTVLAIVTPPIVMLSIMLLSIVMLPISVWTFGGLLAAAPPEVTGEGAERESAATSSDDDPTAATVDGYPIRSSDVRRHLRESLRGRPAGEAVSDFLQAQALEHLVDRRLVLKYLSKNKLGAGTAEIDLAVAQLEKRLQRSDRTLADYYRESGLTATQLRASLAWQIGWKRYQDRYVTEENLRNWFDKNRADFDGRRVKVAHILFQADVADPEAVDRARKEAGQVRAEIVSGTMDFAEAARRHSDAPSGKQGGEQGYIERHQPMPEGFAAAAFQLAAGGISEPVVGTHGVHLIQCLHVEAGKRQWTDARSDLENALRRYLFEWTASRQRPQSEVHYTGAAPYFRPGSRIVVAPTASQDSSP